MGKTYKIVMIRSPAMLSYCCAVLLSCCHTVNCHMVILLQSHTDTLSYCDMVILTYFYTVLLSYVYIECQTVNCTYCNAVDLQN